MKAKVLSVQQRKSKNGNVYNKALIAFPDGVCGFIFDKDCKCTVGAEVEVTFGTDYMTNVVAVIK